MELNSKKCKVMHFTQRNHRVEHTYFLEEVTAPVALEQSTSERDLGVQITADLKQHDQVSLATAKANKVLGMLKGAFTSRDAALWKRLYTIYVRPHIEFAI